jgi:hypothetical protein
MTFHWIFPEKKMGEHENLLLQDLSRLEHEINEDILNLSHVCTPKEVQEKNGEIRTKMKDYSEKLKVLF